MKSGLAASLARLGAAERMGPRGRWWLEAKSLRACGAEALTGRRRWVPHGTDLVHNGGAHGRGPEHALEGLIETVVIICKLLAEPSLACEFGSVDVDRRIISRVAYVLHGTDPFVA